MDLTRRSLGLGALQASALGLVAAASPLAVAPALADTRSRLTMRGRTDLRLLLQEDHRARLFYDHCRAVLIFPSILKAGFVFGGETGNGVLLSRGGAPMGYYNLSGGSWGLQIGGQDFSYALFFMTPNSLAYLHRSAGFAVGTGPSVVVINASAGADADTTTLTHDVYAFPFNGKGLMADLTLQGTKITPIHPG
ncbi:MAG: lipid-binding SYLF domain-containing protein [Alphaproteobacteria bacterium]|nr:lipid-binding SYLF domain-containing protein [Alphaproteobacteria bacterium]